MKNWQKVLILPLTIAIISFFLNNFFNQKCDCEVKNIENLPSNIPLNDDDYYDDEEEIEYSNIPQKLQEIRVKPKYWFHIYDNESYFTFDTVRTVLNYLDFDEIKMNLEPNGTFHFGWDILWAYQYHDLQKLPIDWKQMKFYQKMNHIPGNHFLTSKMTFGLYTNSKYVPRAFTDINKLQAYAISHPDKLFVIKLKSNRGVELKKVSEMILTDESTLDGYFAQEFISNPLLFNGHKFDFGIYVLLTSVDPLRIYYYSKNMIFRFCSKTYNISDPTDTDRYVVSDSKIPVWEFPGTKDYFENGYNTRDAFDGFLKKIGANVDEIWDKIEDSIRSIIVSKEAFFIEWIKLAGTSKLNHFELFRFDMILDNNLNLHVIEVNQHPNIYPSKYFYRNKVLYENLLYNLFTLIGAGTNFRKFTIQLPNMDVEKMIAHPHSMTVRPEVCLTSFCQRSCSSVCNLCWKCLNSATKYDFLQSYREQMNSGDFKRIFPPEKNQMENFNELYGNLLSENSKLHVEWFKEMCKKNRYFC
ncbi:hypothetical protein PVAND_017090 [Polypedilum vanderplanki]|uniref:Uncharacterized protein n=1 Tax=Polypedilum vanderplanki TaxID=319348 RepID=A0A9J6BHA9_POLVA|nr:hypothetical protein PVAND_017090 [Polypedilum vanderplanki]